MAGSSLGMGRVVGVVAVAAVAMGVSLGSAGRLSYHEAIWAQAAREMIARGEVLVPTLDGRPWLEKPPLGVWLIALAGWAAGGLDEATARLPSAVAATGLALAVATLTARRFGAGMGLLAGAIQATTVWTVARGRLAEADILLACLIAWGIVAFDRVREGASGRPWRWLFFALLGTTALVKGIGFGAALLGATVAVVLIWDRDRATARALLSPTGWVLAAVLALAWPGGVLGRYPEALGLWTLHITDRLAARPGHFAGEPWWEYAVSPFWQTLPWTPLALVGAWLSWRRSGAGVEKGVSGPGEGAELAEGPVPAGRGNPHRLLWAWALAPAVLVSLASVRNGHYLIHALPPWSIWTALGLARLGERLQVRGWPPARLRWGAGALCAVLSLAIAGGYAWLGPRFDRRGAEWAFYETVGRSLGPRAPLVLLYDDWDKQPYPTPFGPTPADLAVRLFYLDRLACCWRLGVESLAAAPPCPGPIAVLGRDRDVPSLRRLGRVETLARGPDHRWDRTYTLFRFTPRPDRLSGFVFKPLSTAPVSHHAGGVWHQEGF